MSSTAMLLPGIVLAGLIGVTLPASVAVAQVSQTPNAQAVAPAQDTPSVSGVVVQAPPKLPQIPPDKKAAFDEEAAKQEAWKKYRESFPPMSDGTLGIKDYPGLHSLLPGSDDAAPPSSAAGR
ncbi:MAG: hypothetical protein ABIO39_06845 [Caulobacteraceae bacterium]